MQKYDYKGITFDNAKGVIEKSGATVTASTKSTNNYIDELKQNNIFVKSEEKRDFFIKNKEELLKDIANIVVEKVAFDIDFKDDTASVKKLTAEHIVNILLTVGCLFKK